MTTLGRAVNVIAAGPGEARSRSLLARPGEGEETGRGDGEGSRPVAAPDRGRSVPRGGEERMGRGPSVAGGTQSCAVRPPLIAFGGWCYTARQQRSGGGGGGCMTSVVVMSAHLGWLTAATVAQRRVIFHRTEQTRASSAAEA